MELAAIIVGAVINGLVMVGVVRTELRALRRDVDKQDDRITFLERKQCTPS
jgi:hypothetical protein